MLVTMICFYRMIDCRKVLSLTLSPCPWVVDLLGVVSCPPKGKITVGQYVASCAASEKNWTTYEIVETLLELGTRKEADLVLKFSTEEDSSNEDRKFLADGSILFFFFLNMKIV